MKTISIITQKGGVGKTTGTIHIGAALAELGYNVLLIDFDTQINLTLGYNIENAEYDVLDFIQNKKPLNLIQKGRTDKLFILPGSTELKEKNLTKNSLKKPLTGLEDRFDFVLIDCPPKPINDELSLGEIAVMASDFVISPILADKYSLAGIGSFLNSIQDLKKKGSVKANVLGFFFNVVEEKTTHFQNYYSLLSDSDAKSLLFKEYIRKDVNVKNAMDEGKTIFEVKPYGRASRDYSNLTKEILSKVDND
jgi:chromosome partitioning protein